MRSDNRGSHLCSNIKIWVSERKRESAYSVISPFNITNLQCDRILFSPIKIRYTVIYRRLSVKCKMSKLTIFLVRPSSNCTQFYPLLYVNSNPPQRSTAELENLMKIANSTNLTIF